MQEKSSGFTVIELLVVIAIIGVLATLGMASFNYAKNYAKTAKVKHDLAEIEKAINMLGNDSGQWPGHQEVNKINVANNNEICALGCVFGLSDGRSGILATDGVYTNWGGPYLEQPAKDPWGREYFFDTDYRIKLDGKPCAGSGACVDAVALGSYGPDGIGNNQYTSDDIIKVIKR